MENTTLRMVLLRNSCILIITIALTQIFTNANEDKSGDKETELLEKEYGVKYASACEGKFN